jgi:hypothetical protein
MRRENDRFRIPAYRASAGAIETGERRGDLAPELLRLIILRLAREALQPDFQDGPLVIVG